MALYLNEQLEDLYLLTKALQKKDVETEKKLRQKTGVNDDMETLIATLRFMQIGMAPTYEFAKAMYAQEQEIILKTNQNRNSAKHTYDFIETDINSYARREWKNQEIRANLDARLKESQRDLEDAKDYHSAIVGSDD